MAEHEVLNASGKAVGKVDLADAVFAGEVKPHLFHEVVVSQLAKRRGGNASTKERNAVRGSGAKPFRQKGTGRARQGTAKSPLLTGGGVVFGPHPRSYAYKVPKKVRKAAVRSALSLKRQEKNLIVLDAIAMDEIKTKRFIGMMNGLGVESALFVLAGPDEKVELSARNVPGVKVLPAKGLNCYDILRFPKLVVARDALEHIEGVYS